MGRVVVGMRTSVDGFVADRDGNSSALYPGSGERRENDVEEASRQRASADRELD
jgi:hypothetical protein